MPVGSTAMDIHNMAHLQATGFDQYGNYHAEYDPNVAVHAAHMAAIPTYGAHSSSSAGGTSNVGSTFFDANTMMGINNPAEGYQPSPFIEANQHLLTHGPVDTSFLPSSGSEESSGSIDAGVAASGHDVGATGGGKG